MAKPSTVMPVADGADFAGFDTLPGFDLGNVFCVPCNSPVKAGQEPGNPGCLDPDCKYQGHRDTLIKVPLAVAG